MDYEYRKDGWPFCPRCGEDELWSAKIPAQPTDALSCYRCQWTGVVPKRGTLSGNVER